VKIIKYKKASQEIPLSQNLKESSTTASSHLAGELLLLRTFLPKDNTKEN
jgi:hypothetical protein